MENPPDTVEEQPDYEQIAALALAPLEKAREWMLELAEQFGAIEAVLSESRRKEEKRKEAETGEAVPEYVVPLLRYGAVNPEKLAGAGRALALFHAHAFKKQADSLLCAMSPESAINSNG